MQILQPTQVQPLKMEPATRVILRLSVDEFPHWSDMDTVEVLKSFFGYIGRSEEELEGERHYWRTEPPYQETARPQRRFHIILDLEKGLTHDDQSSTTIVPTPTTEPDWFQTRPQSYQGVTATGSAPLLAETNPVYFEQKSWAPNDPLQTSQNGYRQNSPYFVPEDGFGVEEYPLPSGASISQVHLIHRHGSRYPPDSESIAQWAQGITNASAQGTVTEFTGALSFLNTYTWNQGVNILVRKGRQELFDSGVWHFYNYGALYNSSSKLVVRSTSSDRTLMSAENFLAGFFGLDWRQNANILPLISGAGFNSSLTGMSNIYLKRKTELFQTLSGRNYNWTVADIANAQALCSYETVNFGYSPFYALFTYDEWQGYSYASSIMSSSLMGFGSPISRATGIAWVQEFLSRVEGHLLNIPARGTSANMTLDTNPFAQLLPAAGPPKHQRFHADQVTPFAGRLNIEIIKAPQRVRARRWILFLEIQRESSEKARFEYSCNGDWEVGAYGSVTDGSGSAAVSE
ncbi:histidine phosphatase superfamily [Aspergillus crustosus]